ncbi:MAG: VWA domain-containing protein [Anaerolineales bacterium]
MRSHVLNLDPAGMRRSRGQSLVLIALTFVGILAFVGFVVDTGISFLYQNWLNHAVDAASLAAGYELPNIKAACARAVEYLETNGYQAGEDLRYQIIFAAVPSAPGGDPGVFVIDSVVDGVATPADCASVSVPAQHDNVHYEVELWAEQETPVIFMGLVGFDKVMVGTSAESERSERYDVALVLDVSGSMKFDTCAWFRPEDEYACQNRYSPCSAAWMDDFQSYAKASDLEAEGWEFNSGVTLKTTDGHESTRSIEIWRNGDTRGSLRRTVNTTGLSDVALLFWARDVDMEDWDRMKVYWRPNDGVGWSEIMSVQGSDLPSSWTQYSVLLPSSAADNPDLEIGFRAVTSWNRGFRIDDVEIASCVENPGPWVWFKPDFDDGCRPDRPMTCDVDAPETLIPAVYPEGGGSPMPQYLEQPMLDVILAAETFVDLMDARRPLGEPRIDQIGLASYESNSQVLHSLTVDFESVKLTLFNRLRAFGGTNLGGGMNAGMSVLAGGRSNSTHFMILLTDGWPNFYDLPYVDPTDCGLGCPTTDPCRRSLEYIDAQILEAQRQNVTIFTIGLGEDLNTRTFDASSAYGPGTENFSGMDVLERIANSTGGTAYHAPTSEELEQIFHWISEAIFVRLSS